MSELELISWNVNGIRAIHRKGFIDWLSENKPDIIRTIFNKKLIKKLLSDKDIINNKLIKITLDG